MGCYIQLAGEKFRKADILRHLTSAEDWDPTQDFNTKPPDKVIVCVVSNPAFEAAGVAYSDREYNLMREPGDRRPKEWLLIPYGEVKKLEPEVANYIATARRHGEQV